MIASPVSIRLSWASLALMLATLGVTIYLTIAHYQSDVLVCAVGGDCHTVQNSKYAMLGPIPVALLGLLMSITLLGLWWARHRNLLDPFTATAAIFLILIAGVAGEAYLTYVEIWVIDAICTWCVTFATLLVIMTVIELLQLIRITNAEE